MNSYTESMARITALRAIYDYGDFYRPRYSLRELRRLAVLCFGASMVAFWWLAQVI